MVTVISGANEAVSDLAGQSVNQVKASFAQALNIAPTASATVNGRAADGSQILQENDRLVFAQALAEKGR